MRRLAKKEHSAMLAQLASRTTAIMKFGAGMVSSVREGEGFVRTKFVLLF